MFENIVASVVGGLLLVGAGMIIQLWRFRSTRAVRVFEPDPNGKFNVTFYEHLCRQIERAREDILITGEGFEYAGQAGERVAEMFERSTRKALENGVRVKRYQSASCLHPRWAAHLRELLVDHPGAFTLFLVGGKKEAQVASFCVIDADKRRCVSEFMLSRRRDFGDASANIAATAVFIHGARAFADALRSSLVAIEQQRSVRLVATPGELDSFLGDSALLYFAYGSNMDERQMLKRCPGATRVGVAKLARHRMVFNRKGTYRDGAVASVEATPEVADNVVYGVVWQMTAEDFAEMDRIEDPNAYARRAVIVDCAGQHMTCDTYVAFPHDSPPPPDDEYVRLLLAAAASVELPSSYVTRLRGWLADLGWESAN